MYTSCGWFFDDLSGIETVQVLQYAGRVVQLAERLFAESVEPAFVERLRRARSNRPECGDGARVWETSVKPGMVDLVKVGAHYALSSMFRHQPDEARLYCYQSVRKDHRAIDAGRLKLALGRAEFTSEITGERGELSYGVLHFGDHNICGGVRVSGDEEHYLALSRAAMEAFSHADVPAVIRLLDSGFGTNIYSLESLFRDEQRAILELILNATLGEAETVYRQLYEHHAPFMRFLSGLGTPLPKEFRTTAEYALNGDLRRAFAEEHLDLTRVRSLLEQVEMGRVELDATTLEFTLRRNLERLAQRLAADPANEHLLARLDGAAGLLRILPFPVTLWNVQNVCYRLLRDFYPAVRERAIGGDAHAGAWVARFLKLGQKLSLRMDREARPPRR
jgi:hypothetical protein